MYKTYSTWILVIAIASFALPAAAADEVIPATSEDIEAFDRALAQTRQQERTRRREEVQDEKGEAEPTGEAAREKARVQTRTHAEEALSTAVSEEAEKLKNEQTQVQEQSRERTRARSEQQLEDDQGTMVRSRTMRDWSGGEGERAGQGGPPEGFGSSGGGPGASDPNGTIQGGGGRRGR